MGGIKKKPTLNPVELALFLVFIAISFRSVFSLVNGPGGLSEVNDPQSTANAQETENRRPAAIQTIELDCVKSEPQTTSLDRVRLSGALCGQESESVRLLKTDIKNLANGDEGTAFNQGSNFLTDYIPLESGENSLQVKFIYEGGKTVTRNLKIIRN